jgi:hypothetical protein
MRAAPRALWLPALLSILWSPAAYAQESPFLPDRTFQLLNGEISGDAAFETIRHFTQFHRIPASPPPPTICTSGPWNTAWRT